MQSIEPIATQSKMNLPTFEQRISNLKSAIRAITRYPDFDKILDAGRSDDKSIDLIAVEQIIDRLLKAYQLTVKDDKND